MGAHTMYLQQLDEFPLPFAQNFEKDGACIRKVNKRVTPTFALIHRFLSYLGGGGGGGSLSSSVISFLSVTSNNIRIVPIK